MSAVVLTNGSCSERIEDPSAGAIRHLTPGYAAHAPPCAVGRPARAPPCAARRPADVPLCAPAHTVRCLPCAPARGGPPALDQSPHQLPCSNPCIASPVRLLPGAPSRFVECDRRCRRPLLPSRGAARPHGGLTKQRRRSPDRPRRHNVAMTTNPATPESFRSDEVPAGQCMPPISRRHDSAGAQPRSSSVPEKLISMSIAPDSPAAFIDIEVVDPPLHS